MSTSSRPTYRLVTRSPRISCRVGNPLARPPRPRVSPRSKLLPSRRKSLSPLPARRARLPQVSAGSCAHRRTPRILGSRCRSPVGPSTRSRSPSHPRRSPRPQHRPGRRIPRAGPSWKLKHGN